MIEYSYSYLDRSILTEAVADSDDAIGDTELTEDDAVDDDDLYMFGSWMDRSDRAETMNIRYLYRLTILNQFQYIAEL